MRTGRIGSAFIIPRAHIDHFTDLPDEVAAHIMCVAQRIGRTLLSELRPQRIGYLVPGYGVAHAHFIVLPQHDPQDLTSARFARIVDGRITFSVKHVPRPSREELDTLAEEIRATLV